ncbi:MAG: flavin reductase family protein [Candidatus Zixiibacteriota bacterium]
MTENSSNITPSAFRRTMGLFATGVTVMLTEADSDVHGMTANAVSSLSLDPMLILICVKKGSRTAELVQKAKYFSINFLGAHQEALSNYFAGIKTGKKVDFQIEPWKQGKRLNNCLAAVLCSLANITEGGDHWIVIGKVEDLYINENSTEPLLVFGGSYHTLGAQPIAPAPDTWEPLSNIPQIFYDPWENQ